jgi:uncharacterized protein (TIGR03437 family)
VDNSTSGRIWLIPFLIACASGTSTIAQAVTLTTSPSSINFSYITGSALPGPQSASVKASTGTPSYTVSITGSSTLWLTATPDTGKIPAALSVRVNPTGLSVGTYQATISIAVVGAVSPAVIPVTLVVSSPQPMLSVSATNLSFLAPPLQPAPQTIKLSTTGGPVSFTALASPSAWLQVSPSSGVVLPGEQATLTITADATTLNPQSVQYTGKITIVATGVPTANKTQNVTVAMVVNSSTPSIASVWPSSAQVNSPATTVTIRGTNFYTATTVNITGVTTPLATTVLSPTVLMAVIPASSLTTAGTLNLVVTNPSPGGASAPGAFTVSSTPVVQAVVSVASNLGPAVSPGELITLYGANIGPVAPAIMADANSDGFADTTLGGVSVTIDGQAAPLLYVSQNQISAQVPYNVTMAAARPVVVTNGSSTANGTVDVVATAPGIFSLDGSGTGQAAALNYNATSGLYTLNQSSAPAKLGDIVVLYVTGEGDYATTITTRTGLLVPASLSPLPQLNPLPVVTIGGATATVQYAGPLVGSILGLLQVNVVVPATATTGPAVPVSITAGGVTSQSGVTLSIHP